MQFDTLNFYDPILALLQSSFLEVLLLSPTLQILVMRPGMQHQVDLLKQSLATINLPLWSSSRKNKTSIEECREVHEYSEEG